jgi:pimeloyl-ACP methyl ester carboxylesterase
VVQARLAARGVRSLAYDRSGMGLSEPGPAPRDGLAIVGDLERLLAEVGEDGPLVLVGHSMAGLHICLFSGRNRDRVRGLVLVDAVTPSMARDSRVRGAAMHYQRFSRAAAAIAGAGLLGPLRGLGDTIGLTGAAKDHKRWAFADADHNRTSADEVIQWEAAASQALAVGPLDTAWPVAVVSAGAADADSRVKALQSEPALASDRGHIAHVAGAGHASLLGVRFADAIVDGVEHVLKPVWAS